MGIVSSPLSQSNNMKFLLVLAVAASVSAEADPQLLYNYPLAYHHAPLAYHPVVYTAPAVGCRNNDGALVPCAHGVLPYALAAPAPAAEPADEAVESVEKREAVAEPTAEADAEADPEADPWLYYHGLGYAARPYGYGYYGHHLGYAAYAGYHPYAYYGGCRNNYGALVPCA